MSNPLNVTNIPSPRAPVVDPRTGLISTEWYRFFLNLFELTGSGSDATTLSDLQLGPPPFNIDLSDLPDGDVHGPNSATDNALVRFDGTTGKYIQNGVITENDLGSLSNILSQSFADGTAQTVAAGKFWYNGTKGSWNAGMGGGNITQQIGEELFIYGKASAAITDSPLQAVYKTGTVGASGVVTFAPTVSGITDPDQILGIATESIALNGFGRITTHGVVHGITTDGTAFGETWADNDDIWYNPVTGGLTKTKPSAPNMKMMIGTVISAGSGGSGSFFVNLGASSSLGGTDSNVQLGVLANNDLLQYYSTGGYWRNVPVTAIGHGDITTKTADFTVADNEAWLINNKSGSTCTVTLPSASINTNRMLMFLNYQAQTVVSASSNVVPLIGGAAGTAILSNVIGDSCTLVSNGTSWVMTQ